MCLVMVADHERSTMACSNARCSYDHDSSQKFGSMDMRLLSRFLDTAVSSRVALNRDGGSLNVKTKSAMWVSWVRLFDMEAENQHISKTVQAPPFPLHESQSRAITGLRSATSSIALE